jgi:hypothetical protein
MVAFTAMMVLRLFIRMVRVFGTKMEDFIAMMVLRLYMRMVGVFGMRMVYLSEERINEVRNEMENVLCLSFR